EELFDKIGIDFVEPLPTTAQENKYIIIAIDYITKCPETSAIPNATTQQTADFIYKDII
ncbi:9069_t:CDS:1, partial [Gigaspora rosea]